MINDDFIIMYHGGVMPFRGVEMLLKVVEYNKVIKAVILGNGSVEYMAKLRNLANEMSIMDRLLFHIAVPHNELWKYVGAVDVGMILAPAISKNHLYSLPNKFFENIQSETPVICPKYPAMKVLVDKYKIGLLCDPTDIVSVNSCVEKMRTDKAFYLQCKNNIRKAKEDLCWKNEQIILQKAYRNLIH